MLKSFVTYWIFLPAILSGVGRAQQQPSGGTIVATTRLVVLDVLVVDKNGDVVQGLDKSQFQVLEGTVPQTIRNFDGPEAHTMPVNALPVTSTADLEKMGSVPLNVMVIDELNTGFADTARALQSLRKFLETQPAKLPVPTLFLGVGAGRVTVLHDFTQSRDELLSALKSHHTDTDLSALTDQLHMGGPQLPQKSFEKTLSALSQVASSLRGLPGHKNAIWVGGGFSQVFDITQSTDADSQAISDALKLVTQRMMSARISLSTLDPVGVDANGTIGNADILAQLDGTTLLDLNTSASFENLAKTTGGSVVHKRNDLARLITQDADDAGKFYTLTYVPTSASEDAKEYRQISVLMKDPNLRAITRTGYYPATIAEAPVTPAAPKTQTREFKFDLMAAASSRMVYTGLHLFVSTIPGGFNLQVAANDLQWKSQEDGTRTSEFSIVGVAFNAKDKAMAQMAKEIKEQVGATDNINGARVGAKVSLSVPASATRIRFAVRDAATGNVGSFDIPLHP
jgi:VWFA-related protein